MFTTNNDGYWSRIVEGKYHGLFFSLPIWIGFLLFLCLDTLLLSNRRFSGFVWAGLSGRGGGGGGVVAVFGGMLWFCWFAVSVVVIVVFMGMVGIIVFVW